MSLPDLFPNGETIRIRPDPSRLPIDIRLPVDRRPAVFVLALVCLWGAVGTTLTFRSLTPLIEGNSFPLLALAFALASAITLFVLWLGWRALRLYVAEQIVIIDPGLVHYRSRTLWRAVEWHEPLAEYQGIRAGAIAATDGGLPWQVIELVHEDPARSLPLFADRGTHLPPPIGRSLSLLLKLPEIGPDPDG